MVTLQELIQKLDQLDRGLTIYAVHPWQPSSTVVVARPRDDGRIPDEAAAAGCRYFLEVFIALGILHHLPNAGYQKTSEAEKCAKLIEYAEFLSSEAKPYPLLKWDFPVSMTILCRECRKHFGIIVTGEGAADYHCSACGIKQTFDLGTFTGKALEQTRKMRKVPRGGR